MKTKSQVRKEKIAERDLLDTELRSEWSLHMASGLTQTFEYQHCSLLHIYLSVRSEPQTSFIIEQAWKDSKIVVVPQTVVGAHEMKHCLYQDGDRVEPGLYGIPAPVSGQYVTQEYLHESKTLVIVPLVAYNEKLHRVGYGKGYYDRFLKVRKFFAFGLGFSLGFSDEFVVEEHDAELDAVLTEQGLIRKRTTTRS